MGGGFLLPWSIQGSSMDLQLIPAADAYKLIPISVIGMLWLQIHFENSHWDLLAKGMAVVDADSSQALCADALASGLKVGQLERIKSSHY